MPMRRQINVRPQPEAPVGPARGRRMPPAAAGPHTMSPAAQPAARMGTVSASPWGGGASPWGGGGGMRPRRIQGGMHDMKAGGPDAYGGGRPPAQGSPGMAPRRTGWNPMGAAVQQNFTSGMRGPAGTPGAPAPAQSPSDLNNLYHQFYQQRTDLLMQKIAAYKAANPGATDYDAAFGAGNLMNDPEVLALEQQANSYLEQFFQAQYGGPQGSGVQPGSPAAGLLGRMSPVSGPPRVM